MTTSPGPWRWRHHDESGGHALVDASGHIVADVWNASADNAALIASAPRLAAELADAVALLREDFGEVHDHKRPEKQPGCWLCRVAVFLARVTMVLVGNNPDKRYTFSLDARFDLVKAACLHVGTLTFGTIGNRFLSDWARERGATHLLRGVRSAADFEYERGMRNVNGDRVPGLTTVLLCPPRDLCEVSSSMVKGLVGPDGWRDLVAKYVPPARLAALEEMHR